MTLPYPALHATHGGIWIATPDGEMRAVGRSEAVARAAETPMLMLNAPVIGARLGYGDVSGLDLLELFAFVHPARFAVPTPAGRPCRSREPRRPNSSSSAAARACATRWP